MINKPAVSSNPPIIVTASGVVSASGREIIAIHYLNTTAGVGRVDVTGGTTNEGVTLGAGVQNGTDSFEPVQPAKFSKIVVTFTTGTGVVTILTN